MFHGYDSGVVLREDIIERVKCLQAEIDTLQNSIERQKQKATAREGRIQRMKKEMGFIESPKSQSIKRPSIGQVVAGDSSLVLCKPRSP